MKEKLKIKNSHLLNGHFTVLFTFISLFMLGQTLSRNSQYMLTQALYNPAYIGIEAEWGGTLLYRNQWMGFEGAPNTQGLNAYASLKDKHAFGVTVLNDIITLDKNLSMGASYSYGLRLSDNNLLKFGLQASVISVTTNLSGVQIVDDADPLFSKGQISQTVPNFGFGAYYSSDVFYAGFSVPELFYNKISGGSIQAFSFDNEELHFYITGGTKFEISEIFMIAPSVLIKEAIGAPIQFDINSMFILSDAFLVTVGYRTENAAVVGLGYVFGSKATLMYTYDLTLSALRNYNSGSHEVTLGFGFPFYKDDSFTKRKYLTRGGKRK